jgi:hypothetical protein
VYRRNHPPWVVYPNLVESECVSAGTYMYLSLVVHGDPADPRTDDIGGDPTPEWRSRDGR